MVVNYNNLIRNMEMSKYEKGLELLNQLHGKNSGAELVEQFKDVCPKMAEIVIEGVFGDLLQDKALDLRTRELAHIASLTALGHSLPQLRAHTESALVAGATKEEIIEVILQTVYCAGLPVAINAMIAVKDLLI